MSFDESAVLGAVKAGGVSIPLEQGNVFRLKRAETLDVDLPVSIPLEQGNVFRLNSTEKGINGLVVSIPLEQGNVFRPLE